MSATASGTARAPRPDDPRVVRSRAAVIVAARTLFLRKGYAGTTMEDIAVEAGVAKRTVYNNYADKEALFTEVIADVIDRAEAFARGLHEEFTVDITRGNLGTRLHDLAERMALAIVRPEVIALRRLLIGEARGFPALAADYYDRAPHQVMEALARGFEHLGAAGLLRVDDGRRAAAQFAYLVAGEHLDRGMLVGTTPPRAEIIACARDGVRTFLARHGVAGRRRGS